MIKTCILTISCVFIFLLAKAQRTEALLSQAAQYEQQKDEKDALNTYKDVIKLQPTNVKALCRASILSTRQATRETSRKAEDAYLQVAKIYADAALREAADNPEANYAEALVLNQMASMAGAKEKVSDFKQVQKYVSLAIGLDSAYAYAWHLSGKLNYELANLNMMERAAANVLFGGVPKASLQQAIADYEKCRELDKSFILDYYDLAVAYHDNGQDDKAIETLKRALALRSILQDDDSYKDKCRKLLANLQ